MTVRPHLRAALLLLLAVVLGVGAAVAVRSATRDDKDTGRDTMLRPGAAAADGFDPLAYTEDRRADFEARAARGLAHVLFAKSPGGAVASARRTARWRPLIEAAAGDGRIVDADTLEAIVLLESAGREDARASDSLDGAAGLTQILAETGQNLLGMQVDVKRSEQLTRGIARGRRVAARTRERRRVDERFDPAKALKASVRYIAFARGELGDRLDLALAGYHMGVGNLQNVLRDAGAEASDTPYAELYFGTSPLRKRAAYERLAALGDDSSTYLWRVRAAEQIMARLREDPAALQRDAELQNAKASAEEVLHPPGETERFEDPFALGRAQAAGRLRRLDPKQLAAQGFRVSPDMGELAGRLKQSPRLYRALRPEALATLRWIGAAVREASGSKAGLTLTSTARDVEYQRQLTRRNSEATRGYSLHTTGFAFDIARDYASRRQALAFQWALDRLTALNLIAWVREPGAIHVTVSSEAGRLLAPPG